MSSYAGKKGIVSVLAVSMVLGGMAYAVPARAQSTDSSDLLSQIQGTYTALFPAFREDRYDAIWEEKLSAYAGVEAEAAEEVKDVFLGMYESGIHGEEAVKKAEEEPGWFLFDCSFTGGVESMVIDGEEIAGLDADGQEVFRHTYTYYGAIQKNFDPMTEVYMAGVSEEDWPVLSVYEGDGPEDEFKYFAFADDTPAETYHLEFRYGSDPEELARYFTGPYGYWMVSATYQDCEEEMMESCIDLFAQENASSIQMIAEGFLGAGEAAAFAGGSGTKEDPWQIATAEQLDLVREDLAGHYVLVDDIDLSGFENWEPIGAFQPLSEAPEDAEVPHPDYAFTGTFDGGGHTISNLKVESEALMGAGLFGCACGTQEEKAFIGHFTLEDLSVSGGYLVGGAVGLQFMNCLVSDITVQGSNHLTGMQGIGGVVGTGFDLIESCTATAELTVLGDGGACAGIIAGGTTMSPIKGCQAIGGSITAEGNGTWGFGSICGAPWGAAEISGCVAIDTTITVTGEGNRLVGGLVGFGGSYDETAPAKIRDCRVENVTIEVSDTTDQVGGLIGAGKEMMEGSEVLSSFEVEGCSVSGKVIGGGELVGPVVGDPACAVSVDCEGGMELS